MVTEDMMDFGDALARAPIGRELEVARECAVKLAEGQSAAFCVPDFDAAARAYEDGSGSVEEIALGNGAYASLWNREKLSKLLDAAGLQRLGSIESDGYILRAVARRFALPTPRYPMRDIHAVMSMPRVSWTDTMAATHLACAKLGIDFVKSTGVFWGQCLQRIMESVVAQPERKYVLTIDFDSIFDEEDIIRLWQVMETRPDVDAIFPLQIGRDRDSVLLTMVGEDGKRLTTIDSSKFHADAVKCETGHMGLTLFRVDALKRMSKPWFWSTPDERGEWGDAKVDDDIYFWQKWHAAGNKVAVCPRVRIGHLQLVVTWPGDDLRVINQWNGDFSRKGRPDQCKTY